MIFRLIYMSTSSGALRDADLEALMIAARRNNERDNITGVAAYHDHTIIQVLEGDRAKVDACFDRICQSPMHHSVLLVLAEDVPDRIFDRYSMAFVPADAENKPTNTAFVDLRDLFTGQRGQQLNKDAVTSGFLETFKEALRVH
ncbi:hypothetical protein NBRC116601_02220 [Cognatishimia sp. WU-CL00825]|uniref:BLUF domain-containing protein n=1 Tax=Cognatishimia sp. WU-CL00825 TaxID=3127658 RepID=UPI0031069F63